MRSHTSLAMRLEGRRSDSSRNGFVGNGIPKHYGRTLSLANGKDLYGAWQGIQGAVVAHEAPEGFKATRTNPHWSENL